MRSESLEVVDKELRYNIGMTKLEEMMEAHEDATKMSKVWDCSYEEAFRKVWDSVWYDDEGEARDRPSERKARTLLTPGV